MQNFKFMKDLGLKKPAFLPDFGKVLPPFLSGPDRKAPGNLGDWLTYEDENILWRHAGEEEGPLGPILHQF